MKYFGFSNWSIVVRSQFHGLNDIQGRPSGAFIRANPVQPEALPHAPVDQARARNIGRRPIQQWAAGAGL